MVYAGEIPFVRLIVTLIGGILLGYFFSAESLFNPSGCFALVELLSLFFFIICYKTYSLFRFRWIGGVLSHAFILSVGFWLVLNDSEKYDGKHYRFSKSDVFFAIIKNEPKTSGEITRFEAHVTQSIFESRQDQASGTIMVSVQSSGTPPQLTYGDAILLPGSYDSIDPPYNPGEFNYKLYLANHQIYHQTFISGDDIRVIAHRQGNFFISFALSLRKQLVEKFNMYLAEKDAAAFASTLILGYKADLSRELVQAYSKTGTMHVLSVSGMHVGIVFLVLTVILKFMDKTHIMRILRALLIILIIWFYALLTGFSAPACRAALMLSFIVLGKALNKHQNTYNLIAISAFFLLLYDPFYLFDAGFQLSYLAVIGLVYFHPKIYHLFFVKNKILDYIWSYTALSIAAQLATFPFSIYYFHQFPIYFLLSNLFLVFPVALIMYAGIIFMFIPFPFILHPFGKCLSWLISTTNNSLYYIENLPYASWEGIWITSLECFILCLLLLAICIRLSSGERKVMVPISILTVILVGSLSWNQLKTYRQSKIVFYSLKKNTAIAYISRHQSVIVSDVAVNDKLMNFSVLPGVKSSFSRHELFFDMAAEFLGATYYGENNFYQFHNSKILIWNKNFDSINFLKRLAVDYVLVSDNPRTTIERIASCVRFTTIIFQGNNPDYKIEGWIKEAEANNYKYYLLKKRPALIVNL